MSSRAPFGPHPFLSKKFEDKPCGDNPACGAAYYTPKNFVEGHFIKFVGNKICLPRLAKQLVRFHPLSPQHWETRQLITDDSKSQLMPECSWRIYLFQSSGLVLFSAIIPFFLFFTWRYWQKTLTKESIEKKVYNLEHASSAFNKTKRIYGVNFYETR